MDAEKQARLLAKWNNPNLKKESTPDLVIPEWKKRPAPQEVEREAAEQKKVKREAAEPKGVRREAAGKTWFDPTLSEWDPNDFRIFVGDLGKEVDDQMLQAAFIRFASFKKAKVVKEQRTGKSKGYGFVSFSHADDFLTALREVNGKYIGSRPCKLRRSNWKDRSA